VEIKPRDDTPVQLEIKNVRDLVDGPGPSTSTTPDIALSSTAQTGREISSNDSPITTSAKNTADPLGDSLEQLLEDARRMKEAESGGDGRESGTSNNILSDEQGTGLKETIRNVLSTIVTADFFVVCGFLLWFLAGIFCSSILKDDTVQIAFNSK